MTTSYQIYHTMITENDKNLLNRKGISEEKLNAQLACFAQGFPFLKLAGAASVEVDKQGRILIPSVLREFADITKDAVLIGVGSRIEIWSKDRWEGTVTYQDMEDISKHMVELGIGI